MAPSIIPSFSEINKLFSNFNASLVDALRERSFSLEQVHDIAPAVAHSLSSIHRYQNTLIPVGTLPPEVLIRVFESVVAPSPDVHDTKPRRPAQRAIMLTRVCFSWREIALSTSHLWSQVVEEDSPRLARLFLRRSRAADIRLYASSQRFPSKPSSVWQDVLQNHSHRVRELHLQLCFVTSAKTYVDDLSTPLPALEILTFKTDLPRLLSNIQFPPTPLIFGGQALQNLKTLVLSRVHSFMPGNPLPNLVNLQLHCVGDGLPTAQNLLHVLSNCPRLETFKLFAWFSGPSFDFDNRSNPQPIPLRSLKALWIRHLYIMPTLALLSRLEFPAETTIRLGNLHDLSGHYAPRTPGSLLPDGRPSPFERITGLTHLDIIEEREEREKRGPVDRTALYVVAHGARAGIWIHLAVENRTTNERVRDRLFGQLLDMLPTEAVARLRVSTLGLSAARVARVLGGTPTLATLVLRWPSVPNPTGLGLGTILDDLGFALAPRSDSEEGDNMDVPVPLLKSFTIEVDGTWAPALATAFVEAIKARTRCGHPLREVACSAQGAEHISLMGHLQDHVETIELTEQKLWEVTSIPSVWAVANDDGSLFPRELRYGWTVPRDTYKSNSWDI